MNAGDQLPKSDWVIVSEICQEKGINMQILVWPEKYRDDISSANRARTLKEARKRGVTIQGLSSLCPLSERRLRSIVGNGEAQSDIYGSQTEGA